MVLSSLYIDFTLDLRDVFLANENWLIIIIIHGIFFQFYV